ncbi:hypothetical protein P8452_00413 [Trifolium repens]|nr:hypothetical protein P8452_00413 [Trifolium repens]
MHMLVRCLNGSKVIVIFIILLVLAISVYGTNNDGSFYRQKILEVERKVQHLRKHSLKTIQSEDGDTIDCIDINKVNIQVNIISIVFYHWDILASRAQYIGDC